MGVGGGVERVLTLKANYMASLGHEVRIATCCPLRQAPVYGLDPSIAIDTLEVDYAEDFRNPIGKRIGNTLKKMWQHYRLIKPYLERERADVVVTTHAYEMAFLPWVGDGSPKVLELHSSEMMYQMQREGRSGLATRLLVRSLIMRDRLVCRLFDAVGVLTHEDFVRRGSPSNMHVIPNPSPFRAERRSDCSSHTILAVGRYTEEKDFASLLDIWSGLEADFPEWELRIVGDGHLRDALEAQVKRLALERAYLESATSDPRPYYERASIYAMTSTFEGFGLVLVEAQAYGVPAVSYACPSGPSDIVVEGTGYLVAPGDKRAFGERLRELMQDESLRQAMGQKAFEASSRYNTERVMGLWLDLFDRLMQRR